MSKQGFIDMASQLLTALKYNIKTMTSKFGIEVQKRNPYLDNGLICQPQMPQILDWYLNTAGADDFFFIQIGANDGLRHDPLHNLIRKYGLKGCLLEPQANVFEKLKDNYKDQSQLILECSAVADKSGELTFYSLSEDLNFEEDDFNFSVMSSFDRDHVYRNFERFARRYSVQGKADDYIREIKVPSLTFEDLFKKHSITHIDLLQIDAEGYDFEILKLFDFKKQKPPMVHFEHNSLSQSDRKAAWEMLKIHGYTNCLCGTDTLALLSEKGERQ